LFPLFIAENNKSDTSMPTQSISGVGFSRFAPLARKWRLAQRLYQKEGTSTLLAELLFQLSKPLVWAYETARWWWYRIRGQKSFAVLGHEIGVFPKDSGISRELALHRVHEPLATRLLLETLKPGMNVIDIGSNIGYYALLEARLIGPQGLVIAIEPMQENARQLIRNIQTNGYRNILVHEFAIANRNGTADMHVSEKSNWHCLSAVPGTGKKRQVPISTLDKLLASLRLARVDLMRMDLEGYEIEVLEGMQSALQIYGPRLLVELHPHIIGTQPIVKYLRSLKNLGYGVEWLIEQDRDVALRWRFLKAEKPTMDDLMCDPRICRDPRAITVLLSKDTAACLEPREQLRDEGLGTAERRSRRA
jgi:FkbM family methyltransferase